MKHLQGMTKTDLHLVMTNRERIQRGDVDKEHMELALRGDTSGMADYMSKKNLKVHIDLFTLDNKEYKVILIEAAPGSGKTTLLRYITQKWGSGELFCQFSLVLLIQLHDIEVQKAKCLADLIPFVFDPDRVKAIAKKIALKDGKGVLLLFDGWDELPIDMQSKSLFREVIRVPQKHALSKAVVLVSARQIISANIQQYVTTRIEIIGFTPEQIEMYVKESLPDKEADKLMATIKDDPVLEGNCYLPLSTAIITHTYICMDHALPATFCRIIMELALSCLYRHIKKNTPYGYLYVTLNSFDDLQNTEKEQFDSLCNKAYSSLLREEYSFHDPNMPTLGLVQSVQSFVVRGKSTQQYFLHLSLQELCAARYFISLPTDEQMSLYRDFIRCKARQMVGMLPFYSAIGGLNTLSAKQELMDYFWEIFSIDKSKKEALIKPKAVRLGEKGVIHSHFMLFDHILESQNPEVCQLLPSEIDTMDYQVSTRDVIAMKYIISNKKLELFQMRNKGLSVHHLKLLTPALAKNMLTVLVIRDTSIGDEGVTVVADAIKGTTSLRMLSFVNVGMTEVSAKVLGDALCNSNVQVLMVSQNKLGSVWLSRLTSHLMNTNINYLGINDSAIGDEGMISLSSILPMTKIVSLDVGGNCISRIGLDPLADAIMTKDFRAISFVTTILRNKDLISLEDIKHFLTRIQFHPVFYELSISVNFKELNVFIKALNEARSVHGLRGIRLQINESYKLLH